ncbi:MAG: winged helix-turn-helix transcriptional regulator [Planctomycetes bacterium]|nr:winged helix-turn-helix transcriptional regulator [Planctomycetota bacterium]
MNARLPKLRVKAKLFRGLADPSRLAILEALRGGPRNVSQVVARTGLTQSNASMHLDCLWCCGLVDREARGRFTYYWIRSRKVARILEVAEGVLDHAYERLAACRRYEEAKR